MRDRLIDLIHDSDLSLDSVRLADYLLANGVIVLPCKLNQTMWRVLGKNIDKCKVSGITQKADGSFKIRLTHSRYRSVFEITPDRIGEDIFLTKEEAEAELRKRCNNA